MPNLNALQGKGQEQSVMTSYRGVLLLPLQQQAICTIPWIRDSLAQTSSGFETAGSVSVGLGAVVGILPILAGTVWMVVLMWNAFSVACNMKGGKGAALFIAALVLGETVTKIVVLNYL